MLDGVDPDVLAAVEHAARRAPGVYDVTDVRARWIGHRMTIELNVSVNAALTVDAGHRVAKEAQHQIVHHVPHIAGVTVHVDPVAEAGDGYHRVEGHVHDGLPVHSHG
jgi:divalent metal cation (Fe/Co/Zn/Cd) transporter